MGDKVGVGAVDLRNPEKAQGPPGPGQSARLDEVEKGAGALQDGRAAAGIIVGPGVGVVEVGNEPDLLVGEFPPGDRAFDDSIFPGREVGLDIGPQDDFSPIVEKPLEFPAQAFGDAEAERGRPSVLFERKEMIPGDEVREIVKIITAIGNDSSRAPFENGQLVDEIDPALSLRRGSQDELPGDVLSFIVRGLNALAHVDELGFDGRRAAVAGQGSRHFGPGDEMFRLGGDHPEFGPVYRPAGEAQARRVMDFSVGRKLFHRDTVETDFPRLLENIRSGFIVTRGHEPAMDERQAPNIVKRPLAGSPVDDGLDPARAQAGKDLPVRSPSALEQHRQARDRDKKDSFLSHG